MSGVEEVKIPEELRIRSEAFLKGLENDYLAACDKYDKLANDAQEYLSLKTFLTKEMDYGQKADRKVSFCLGHGIYTKAKIKAEQKIFVAVSEDKHKEMSYEEANEFVGKRLDTLNENMEALATTMANIKAHITFVQATTNIGTS